MRAPPGPPDNELVARVVARDDRHAFAALVRRHQASVRGLLRRLTAGDQALADDLAQETFLRAYRALGAFRGEAELSSWLLRIAHRAFLSDARAAAARRAEADEPPSRPTSWLGTTSLVLSGSSPPRSAPRSRSPTPRTSRTRRPPPSSTGLSGP